MARNSAAISYLYTKLHPEWQWLSYLFGFMLYSNRKTKVLKCPDLTSTTCCDNYQPPGWLIWNLISLVGKAGSRPVTLLCWCDEFFGPSHRCPVTSMIWVVVCDCGALVLNIWHLLYCSRFALQYAIILRFTIQLFLFPMVQRSHCGAGKRPGNSNCHTLAVEMFVGICDRNNAFLSTRFKIIIVPPHIYMGILTCRDDIPPISI